MFRVPNALSPKTLAKPTYELVVNSVQIVTFPSHGGAYVLFGGIVYDPPEYFQEGWWDSFTYQVCDDNGACDTAEVTILK